MTHTGIRQEFVVGRPGFEEERQETYTFGGQGFVAGSGGLELALVDYGVGVDGRHSELDKFFSGAIFLRDGLEMVFLSFGTRIGFR